MDSKIQANGCEFSLKLHSVFPDSLAKLSGLQASETAKNLASFDMTLGPALLQHAIKVCLNHNENAGGDILIDPVSFVPYLEGARKYLNLGEVTRSLENDDFRVIGTFFVLLRSL